MDPADPLAVSAVLALVHNPRPGGALPLVRIPREPVVKGAP